MHHIFWFGLAGWAAGWVTGREMKPQSHTQWIDALLGIIGGLLMGYLTLDLITLNNWGLLTALIVVAAATALLIWALHRITERLHHAPTSL